MAAAFGASHAAYYAQALAFAAFLAMFPMILGALSIAGLLVRDPATEARFQGLIIQSFPSTAQPEMLNALQGVKQAAGWIGAASVAGLVWSAGGIFSTMEFAFTEIFGIPPRDLVRQRLMGLLMMLVLIVSIGITIAANTLAALLPYAWASGFVIGAVAMIALLTALYRFVPNRTFPLRDVLPGAVLAGALIEVFTLAFPLYVRAAGGFNSYGAQLGLFFLLAAWLYVLSQLVLLGAVYNRLRCGRPTKLGLLASPIPRVEEVGARVIQSERFEPEVRPPSSNREVDMEEHEYAFPKQEKEPIDDAAHVRNAVARFDQVEDVSDADHDEAWKRILAAAKRFGIEVEASSWHELMPGGKSRRR